jgi:hypothetical protein
VSEDDISKVITRHERFLLGIDGVTGIGMGKKTDYKGMQVPCIRIYVEQITEELKKQVPEILDGFPVVMIEVGKASLYR